MAIENGQDLITTGSIVHLARILDETTTPRTMGPCRDLGTVNVINPDVGSDQIELFDSRSGLRVRTSQRVTQWNESYEVNCANMSLDNLAFIFGAQSVDTYSQAATPLTGITHTVFPDSILHLHDNSGNFFYNIASVQSIGSLVAGTDFTTTPEGLKMGYVYIKPAASGVSASGTNLAVAFTPTAISAANRVFLPHKAGIAKCQAWVYWNAENYSDIRLRDTIDVNVTPAGAEFNDGDYSRIRLRLQVLSNPRNTTMPGGRYLKPVGSLASQSYS